MYRIAYNILNGGYNYNYNYNNVNQQNTKPKEGGNFYIMILCICCCSLVYILGGYAFKNAIDTDCDLRKSIKGNPCRKCVLNNGYSFKKPPPHSSNKKFYKKAPETIDTEKKCKKWCEDDEDIFGCSFFIGNKSKLDATKGSSEFFVDNKTKCVGMISSKKYFNSSSQEPFTHEIEIDQDVKSGLCLKDYLDFHNNCKLVGGFGCTDSKDTLVATPQLIRNVLIEKNKEKYKKERADMPNDLSNKKYGDMELIDNLSSKKCKDLCYTHNAKNCTYRESDQEKYCYWGTECPYFLPAHSDIGLLTNYPPGFFFTNDNYKKIKKNIEKEYKSYKKKYCFKKDGKLECKKNVFKDINFEKFLLKKSGYKKGDMEAYIAFFIKQRGSNTNTLGLLDNLSKKEIVDYILLDFWMNAEFSSLVGTEIKKFDNDNDTFIRADLIDKFSFWGSRCDGNNVVSTSKVKSPANSSFYSANKIIDIDQSKMNIGNIYYK
jgi:hypothetical protein